MSFGIAVVVLIVAALGFDLSVADVRSTSDGRPTAGTFFDKTSFCPPTADTSGSTYVSAAAASSTAATVGLRPEQDETVDLPPDKFLLHRNAEDKPLEVVAYGAPARAGVIQTFPSPIPGAGAARCSDAASAHWYFADGSTALGFDERLLIYNPFPDEAVVKVTLFTPGGVKAKANLSDVGVPAGRSVVLELNKFTLQQRIVGTAVDVVRGRVVAWKSMSVKTQALSPGVQLTLGAAAPATTWYFPEGGVAAGLDERVTLLNPGRDEAIVTMSVMTAEKTVQPPKLVEIRIPGTSVKQIDLTNAAGRSGSDLGGASVIVRSANQIGVIAERTIYYSGSDLKGTAAEIGAYRTSPSWILPPAVVKPSTESIVVMNPGTEAVDVRVKLIGTSGAPLEPLALRAKVPAGARFKFPLGQVTKGRAMYALVEADGEIVAERVAYSGSDVSSVVGWPSTQTAP
jgi:hypothetical protein